MGKSNNICNRMAKLLTKIGKRWTRNIGRDSNQLCKYLFLKDLKLSTRTNSKGELTMEANIITIKTRNQKDKDKNRLNKDWVTNSNINQNNN